MTRTRRSLFVVLACGSVLASCNEEKIRTYRVAADEPVEEPAAPPEAIAPAESNSGPLRWKAPDEWAEETPGQFQTALYRLGPDILVSVSKFPGDAGGMDANVNRWRQQVGLEITSDIGGEIIALEKGESRAKWFDLRGEKDGILAAIVPLDAETWFFKLSSPVAELDTWRPAFTKLLMSIEIGSPAESAAPPTEPEKPRIDFKVPEGWVRNEGSAMRVASFRIPVDAGGIEGDVSVIPLMGDGGTDVENVNRWRAQLRLPALESDTDPALGNKIDGASGPLLVTHMLSAEPLFSEDRKGAISTAILRVGEVTWFFKMAGDEGVVGNNKEKFESFVRSAVLP